MRSQLRIRGESIGIPVKCSARAVGSALVLGALGSACVLLLAACGSGSAAPAASSTPATAAQSSPSSTSATGTSTTASGSLTAYRSCLQAHGVTFGAGGGFGGGGGFFRGGGGPPPAAADGSTTGAAATGTTGTTGTTGATTPRARPPRSAAQQQAFAACASLRPAGGFGGGRFGGGGFAGGGGFTSGNPAFARFQACLKQHGVQTGSAPSRTSPAFQSAFSACRSLLPAGGFGRGAGGGAPGGGANGATFARYQACLRQHGVRTGATTQSASTLQAAITACRSVLPNGGNGSAQTTTTTPTTTTG